MRLKDIAEIANVSIATVSKVMNGKTSELSDETIELVEKIIKEQGYVPNSIARAMKTNRTHILGLIIPDIRNPFFTEMARGAEDAAYELGYSLFLCNTDDEYEKELKYLYSLQSLRIDGIILAGSFKRNEELEKSHKFNIPMVSIDRAVHYDNVSTSIETENFESSKQLAELMYENGYRSFLYIGGVKESSVSIERFEGTVEGLKGKDIKRFDSLFGRYVMEFGYESIMNQKNIKDYDIVICGNDLIALGVIEALDSLNIKVPEDMGVTGYDNIDLSKSFRPVLTTVHQPTYEMGAFSVKKLCDIIEGKDFETSYFLEQKVLVRNSTLKKHTNHEK